MYPKNLRLSDHELLPKYNGYSIACLEHIPLQATYEPCDNTFSIVMLFGHNDDDDGNDDNYHNQRDTDDVNGKDADTDVNNNEIIVLSSVNFL